MEGNVESCQGSVLHSINRAVPSTQGRCVMSAESQNIIICTLWRKISLKLTKYMYY